MGNLDWTNHHRIRFSQDLLRPLYGYMPCLSITEKLSSAIIPATTITRLSRREQREIEFGRLEEETIEVRIINLEKRVNMFQTLLVKEKERTTAPLDN